MTNRERFHRLMRFEDVDRLPILEWATWWDKTIARWHEEGLPPDITECGAIKDFFGHDVYRQVWIPIHKPTFRGAVEHGAAVVSSMEEYEAVREHLYPDPESIADPGSGKPLLTMLRDDYAPRQATGEMVVWITLNGHFWFPRTLFGIEQHLYAFYMQPELMHRMNADLLEFNLRLYDAVCEVCVPDFMTFAEDMSYNNGPMIGKDMFDEYMMPYYKQITPVLNERGTVPIVDSDGEISQLIPWFVEAGVKGFLPLERQAGCDLEAMRKAHPEALFIGAYDKMIMNQGEDALRAEFERLLPVMRQGGFIPSVDHQTPPSVSLEEYGSYMRLLREYCEKAAN
jgi:hypothetical protein